MSNFAWWTEEPCSGATRICKYSAALRGGNSGESRRQQFGDAENGQRGGAAATATAYCPAPGPAGSLGCRLQCRPRIAAGLMAASARVQYCEAGCLCSSEACTRRTETEPRAAPPAICPDSHAAANARPDGRAPSRDTYRTRDGQQKVADTCIVHTVVLPTAVQGEAVIICRSASGCQRGVLKPDCASQSITRVSIDPTSLQ